jgi:predicted RNA binding protein YcfA (HicA-like mRNA interferase family)
MEEHVLVERRGALGSGPASDGTAMTQPYVRAMKVATVLKHLRSDGWVLVTQRGSHRQFKHPSKVGRVTVAGKPSHDLAPGTLKSIMRQAGLEGWLR